MSQFSEEFARMATAERWLWAEAGPLLDTIVKSIERRAGIVIGEVRVTFDRNNGNTGFSAANCTIVRADVVASNVGGPPPNPDRATEVTHSRFSRSEGGVE